MTGDANELPPLIREVTPEVPAVLTDLTYATDARLSVPTADQVRAADGAFAPGSEQETVAALMGLWSSALILHDLAVDTFKAPKEPDDQSATPRG